MELISFTKEDETFNHNEGWDYKVPTVKEENSITPSANLWAAGNNKAKAIINRVWEDKAIETAQRLLDKWSIDKETLLAVRKLITK